MASAFMNAPWPGRGWPVQTAPYNSCIFDVRTAWGSTIPVVCSEAFDGGFDLNLLRFSHSRLISGVSEKRVRAICFTIALLHDFYLSAWHGKLLRSEEIPSFVASFLRARREGFSSETASIRWRPVQRATVERDRLAIAEYSDFCASDLSHCALLPPQAISDADAPAMQNAFRRLARKTSAAQGSDLLHHLASKRQPPMPRAVGHFERNFHRRPSRAPSIMQRDQVRRMIDGAPTPLQKMMFIEAFFGGPRLSEILHQWRCDVLHGSLRRALFPDDRPSDLPVVVLAHPSQALFSGDLHNRTHDRTQAMRLRYNASPRNLVGRGSPLWLGWKGLTFDNEDRRLSQLYWTDQSYATYFQELFLLVQKTVYSAIPINILQSHPYLYVNEMPGRSEYGEPLKLSNARKMFQRAYDRAGVPASIATGSHAGRHYYKEVLTDFLPDRHARQRCMHHHSIESQDDYARNSGAVRAQLYNLLAEAL